MSPARNNVDCGRQTEVVISGISARFPNADTYDEFKEKIYGGVDMITTDSRRFTPGLFGTPSRSGKINILDRFDSNFFHISPRQCQVMDPMVRMLLETTYEAIFDAGINPSSLRGSRTGVYIGLSSSASESNEFYLRDGNTLDGLCGPGCCRSVFSNRISLFFDFKGPSFPVDATCASSLLALELAVGALNSGRIDYAVVGATNVCLKPEDTVMLNKLGVLSLDGCCKAFDISANGYVRSEAVVVTFLQRKTESIFRNYATIVGTLTGSDGFRELGLLAPSEKDQKELLKEVYASAGIETKELSYVEAHGSGTQIGDMHELNAIADVLCAGRTTPLLVGSIKTSCGHSEPAAGLLGILKIIMAAQEHMLPANLHYKTPNPNVPALIDGRIQVVTENTPWEAGLVGVSAYGIGGNTSHAILRMNSKRKGDATILTQAESDNFPTLVLFSGRTKHGTETALRTLTSQPIDKEQIGLLHQFFRHRVQGHDWRGYGLLENGEIEVLKCERRTPRPLWLVFSGMGSQWVGMGRDLLKFETFRMTLNLLSTYLKELNVDLLDLINSGTKEALENVLHSFVLIVAVQIGLVDVLASLGISPDGGIGHSVGELSCSYATGSLTAEQAILAAHARGLSIIESKLPPGAMVSVGLSPAEAKCRCPPLISVSCENTLDNVTLSGPKNLMKKLMETLSSEGIFVRAVASANCAFHSTHMNPVADKLRQRLDAIIPHAKPRSPKWLSTSLPMSRWNSPLATLSSSAYHLNNVLSPVYFLDAVAQIPADALVVEVSSHAILQPILKRGISSTSTYFSLQNRIAPDNSMTFLRTLGKIYSAGLNFDIAKLYTPVNFPVSLETRSIFPLVHWDHSKSWSVPSFEPQVTVNEKTNNQFATTGAKFLQTFLELTLRAIKELNGDSGIPEKERIIELTQNLLPREEILTNGQSEGMMQEDEKSLVAITRRTLGITCKENVKVDVSLAELGLDSLTAIELKAVLVERFAYSQSMEQLLGMNFSDLMSIESGKPVKQIDHTRTTNGLEN